MPSPIRRLGPPLILALVLTFTFLTLPRYPYVLDDAFSWNAVLHFAHERGWQFGDQLIFTYGPLGHLISRYYFPGGEALRVGADLLLCFSTAASVCLVAWRLGKWKGAVLGIVFVLGCANLDPRADLLLYLGLLCWSLLFLVDCGRARGVWGLLLLGTAVYGSLAKVSFLAVAGLTVLALFAALLSRGQWRAGFGLLVGLPVGLTAGWVLAGQQLNHLGTFLAGAWFFSRDYDATMGVDGLPTLRWRGLLIGLCAVAVILLRSTVPLRGITRRSNWPWVIAAGWLAALTLLVAKHALVRADLYHAGTLFVFGPVLALAAQLLPCNSRSAARWANAFALVSCFVAVLTLQELFVSNFSSFLLQPFRAIPSNVGALLRPNAYRSQLVADLQTARQSVVLPRSRERIGNSKVDVFGHDQAYACLNNFNYSPRPVFQSYLAYNRTLMHWNEQWYLSPAAPEFVLFNLAPIDRRFPPLEDSLVLRHLLINYELAEVEPPFLLLKAHGRDAARLTLLREGTLRANERLDLEQFGQTNLWLELGVRPNVLGRLRQFFFKPCKLRFRVGGASSNAVSYPAPAPMLGFLVSPLMLRRDDVLKLYRGEPIVRPKDCALDFGEGEGYWHQPVGYRVYRLENQVGGNSRSPIPDSQ